MTWQEKVQACQVLGEFSLKMRKPDDWYVNHTGVGRSEGCIVSGGCVTGAKTPEEAVHQHWAWLTQLKDDQYIVTSRGQARGTYRWVGYMWMPWTDAA